MIDSPAAIVQSELAWEVNIREQERSCRSGTPDHAKVNRSLPGAIDQSPEESDVSPRVDVVQFNNADEEQRRLVSARRKLHGATVLWIIILKYDRLSSRVLPTPEV